MNIYYVYAYLRKDGTPYYIGKGHGKRAWDWHRHIPVPKDKERIVILETNMTELGAFAIERRMIRWYGRKDLSTGILRNMTDGGEGATGYSHTEETKEKLSNLWSGKSHSKESKEKMKASAMARKPPSTETREKISAANRKRTHSIETRAKLSLALKDRIISEDQKTKTSITMKELWARKKAGIAPA